MKIMKQLMALYTLLQAAQRVVDMVETTDIVVLASSTYSGDYEPSIEIDKERTQRFNHLVLNMKEIFNSLEEEK